MVTGVAYRRYIRCKTVTRPLNDRYKTVTPPAGCPRPGAVNVAPFQPVERPLWPAPPYPALFSAAQPQPKLCPASSTPGTIQGSEYHRPGSSDSAIRAHRGVGHCYAPDEAHVRFDAESEHY